jgi:hypothetical protein
MEGAKLVLLEQAIDDLGTDIVLVVAEDLAIDKSLRAASEIIFEVQEAVPAARHQMEPASQRIVD